MRTFGVPDCFLGVPLADGSEYADTYASNWYRSLLLTGGYGTGKSWLAAFFVKNYLDQMQSELKPDALWILVPELLMRLRNSFRDGHKGETEEQIVSRLSNVNYLVLDDLGAEKTTEYSVSSLYIIIEKRLSMQKQTIITTNLDLAGIERFSPRIASRLATYRLIRLDGKDRRLKQHDEA